MSFQSSNDAGLYPRPADPPATQPRRATVEDLGRAELYKALLVHRRLEADGLIGLTPHSDLQASIEGGFDRMNSKLDRMEEDRQADHKLVLGLLNELLVEFRHIRGEGEAWGAVVDTQVIHTRAGSA